MPHISVVSPVYHAEKIVDLLVSEIVKNVSLITNDFEIILVEDGSKDNSWGRVAENCQRDKRVKGIKLSRNFGQHNAITAGLMHAKGDWVVVMDCDLQDRPDEIVNLYHKALMGFDMVLARRAIRRDTFLKVNTSKAFYSVFSYLTDTKQDPAIANFGIYNRKVIDAVLSMGDYIRVFPILVQWVGFSRGQIDVVHSERQSGNSTYSYLKLFRLAFNMIISFSEKPLIIGIKIGAIISIISFLFGLYNLVIFFNGKILVPGYASLIISIWFFSGLLITFIGLTGLYLSKVFEKVRNRPNFIIEELDNH